MLEIRPAPAFVSVEPTIEEEEFATFFDAVDLDPDARPDLHDGPALLWRDHHRNLAASLQELDPRLQKPLFLAGGVVLGVLLEVTVLACGGDPPDHLRPAGDQAGQFLVQSLEAVRRDVQRLACLLG